MADDDDFVFDLKKDEPFSLKKDGAKTSRFGIGLYWTESHQAGKDFDLDVTAFGCFYPEGSSDPRLVSNRFVCFYKNLVTPCGGIVHSEDDTDGSLAGADNGPNETIVIDTAKLDPRVQVIPIVLTLYDGAERGEDLSMVTDGAVTIFDADSNSTLAQIDVSNDYKTPPGQAAFTAIQVGAFQKEADGSWSYTQFGTGVSGATLQDFVKTYNPAAKFA